MMLTRSKNKRAGLILKSGNELQTNSDMAANLDFNGELQPRKVNPLFIPEITDHMFQFLTLSDVKNCRLVCRQWKQLAEKFQKKLSIVHISVLERLERFNKVFPTAQQSEIFTNFRFFCLKLSVDKFSDFFGKWYHNLSEITLLMVDLRQNEYQGPYDLSPLLPFTLIRLRIHSCKPTMIISTTEKICNIPILELNGCILNIVPGTTLNSVEIDLEDITFQEGKEITDNFLINPLLNFDVLKKAKFGGQDIIMDFHGSHSLEMLTLRKDVTVLNWETSNWEIKELSFQVNSFGEMEHQLPKSQIKYKELKTTLTHLNVSFLPEGIEKLQVTIGSPGSNHFINQDIEFPPGISGEHNFPYLKHLDITLRTVKEISPFLEVLKHCPKLTDLSVSTVYRWCPGSGRTDILKTSSVSPSVKTLRVNCDVRIVVDRSLQLEYLILKYPLDDGKYNAIVQLAKELHVKNLYWMGRDLELNIGGFENRFPNYHQIGNNFKSLIDLNLDNFVVGAFILAHKSEFENSCMFPLVDKQAKYYLFQCGGKGKAISGSVALRYSTFFK